MKTSVKVGLGIAGAVVALGAAVGVGVAASGLVSSSSEAGGPVAGDGRGPDGQGAGRLGQGRGLFANTELVTDLAEKLGVEQSRVESALKEVLATQWRSGAPSAGPSSAPSGDPGGQPRLEAIAQGLAEKLNLDQDQVLEALNQVMSARTAAPPSASPTSR